MYVVAAVVRLGMGVEGCVQSSRDAKVIMVPTCFGSILSWKLCCDSINHSC